jgi:hypothetical protein
MLSQDHLCGPAHFNGCVGSAMLFKAVPVAFAAKGEGWNMHADHNLVSLTSCYWILGYRANPVCPLECHSYFQFGCGYFVHFRGVVSA